MSVTGSMPWAKELMAKRIQRRRRMGRLSGEILVVMGEWSLDVRVVVGVGVLVYEGWR